jgi:hypothetical protein
LTNDEKAEKELRTVFIGNLPVECADKVNRKEMDIQKMQRELIKDLGGFEAIKGQI